MTEARVITAITGLKCRPILDAATEMAKILVEGRISALWGREISPKRRLNKKT